jgi:queuosine precursor transporter
MSGSFKNTVMIVLYLTAIVAANLLVAAFGPSVAVVNAFLFIGLDITARDALHEAWQHEGLWWKMLLLIASGSILSALLNWNAAQIALASFLAFAGAGIADTLVYHALHDRARMLKINGSNVVSAAVDSVLFPALAFGFPLLIGVMIGQFVAKVTGGFVWSVILRTLEPHRQAQSAV